MNDFFVAKVQKLTMIMIIVCILALIFIPLFPWYSSKLEDNTFYASEGTIMAQGEYADDMIDDIYDKKSDEYKGAKAFIGARDNLGGIGIFFWLSFIFAIILLIGVGIYKMGQKYQLFGNIIFLIGTIILIFAIFILLNHVWYIWNVGEIEKILKMDFVFSFNYLPLIWGIILLVASIVYIISVVPASARAIASSLGQRPGYQQGYEAPPAPPPLQPKQAAEKKQPTAAQKFCPGCGAKLEGKPEFCPGCGKKLV